MLLADHAVAGEALQQVVPQRLLGITVRRGDGARIALRLDEQRGAEQWPDDRAGPIRGLPGGRDEGVGNGQGSGGGVAFSVRR